MGYRSDVCIVMKKSAYEDFMVAYAKKFDDTPEYDEVRNIDIAGEYVRIDWYDVKWNSFSDDVVFIDNYLASIDYSEFLRIGEDYDDVEYIAMVPDDEEYRLYCKRSAEVSV